MNRNSADGTTEPDIRIRRYARLLVQVAVNLQPGQLFTIWKAPVAAAPFVRMLTEEAYEAGASYVDVFWQDDYLELIRLMRTLSEVHTEHPDRIGDSGTDVVK